MKAGRLLVVLLCMLVWVESGPAVARADTVRIVSDAELSPAVQKALQSLKQAIADRGLETEQDQKPRNKALNIVLGNAGSSRLVDQLLAEHKLTLDKRPESLLIQHLPDETMPQLLLAGRDERGLMYAVLEAAEAIRHDTTGDNVLSATADAAESPLLKLRSVSVHLFNADLDRDWYFSEAHWHAYFALLAKHRFNNFILTFADQTNYMAPPYPWLFESAEFPQVRVEGLSSQEQSDNYQMLRRISELAAEHGLDITLAIWQQQPVLNPALPHSPSVHNYGPTNLRNLPTGGELARYNNESLARLLRQCPKIRGLQLRLNDESGIEPAEQQEYFAALFAAVKNCGHPVRLDLRYKGLRQAVIDQAASAGLEVMVSTKFWCEHMGLPFHPTQQDPLYSANRFGFGTLLKRPRNYSVGYQLWNQGSSRLLQWGDPAYAARFALSCAQGEGESFEIFAPLSNRGWGNEAGKWPIYADAALQSGKWDFERYWLYYLSFGRMSYNPQTPSIVWRRELAARFAGAAGAMETAYANASQVLPLITATTQFSASEWPYWPEMEAGHTLPVYGVVQPSDYAQFYAARPWGRVPGWRTEGWSGSTGFVQDALADRVTAKWSPIQVSRKLDQLADQTLAALDAAGPQAGRPRTAEYRATELDMRVLAYLARFHAAKKRAALHLAFFDATKEAGRLTQTLEHARQALAAWEQIIALTDGAYYDKLVFGRSNYLIGQRQIDSHGGHWKDWLSLVEGDVKYVEALLRRQDSNSLTYQVYPGEVPPAQPPRVRHTPVIQAAANESIELIVEIESAEPLRGAFAYYRPLDQTRPWKQVEFKRVDDGSYRAVISSREFSADFNLQYYFEARVRGGGTLWPAWEQETPYCVVEIYNP